LSALLYRSVGLREAPLSVTIEGEGFVIIRRKTSEDFKGERAKVSKVVPGPSAVSYNPLVICGKAEKNTGEEVSSTISNNDDDDQRAPAERRSQVPYT